VRIVEVEVKMKRNSKDSVLEDIQVDPIDMKHHRMELRKSLLSSPYWKKEAANQSIFSKGVMIMQKGKFVTVGAVVIIATIVLALAFAFMPQVTKPVQAAVVAEKSYQAIATLSQEELGRLERNLEISEPMDLLYEAKNAKDLKTLTYEEFVGYYPLPGNAGTENLKNLTFLEFTRSDGTTLVAGINQQTNLPEFVLGSTGVSGEPNSPGTEIQNNYVESSLEGNKGLHFQLGDTTLNFTVEGTIDADGNGTFLVNGKEYSAPAGTKFAIGAPPTVTFEGNDVFVNGVKLSPKN
jgi:hypothetical protein